MEIGKRATTLEVQYMLQSLRIPGGWKVAQSIVRLASEPVETWRQVGPSGMKRSMAQAEAARIVAKAHQRIRLADADD